MFEVLANWRVFCSSFSSFFSMIFRLLWLTFSAGKNICASFLAQKYSTAPTEVFLLFLKIGGQYPEDIVLRFISSKNDKFSGKCSRDGFGGAEFPKGQVSKVRDRG